MGIVTDYIHNLIVKQVDEHGLVLWYDPEQHYASVIDNLSLPGTSVARYTDSFFALRHDAATAGNARQAQGEGEIAQLIQVIQQLVQKTNLQTDMMLRVALHLREQYGMVLEAVAAGYSSRHLIWKYVVEGMLRDEGLSPEQIRQRLDEDRRTWNAERDQAADVLEQAIRNLGPDHEDG